MTDAAAGATPTPASYPYAAGTGHGVGQSGNVVTEASRDAGFAKWMDAEAAAYGAIHMLHQRTCGGRLKASSADIEEIARLRREADARFAMLNGTPDASKADGVMTASRPSARAPAHRATAGSRRPQFAGSGMAGTLS